MDTTAPSLPATLTANQKISNLFAHPTITPHDLENLTPPETRQVREMINKTMPRLKGTERDNFLMQIDAILPADTKNDVWEHNHSVISTAISNYLQQHGIMPTKQVVADQTGFSRQTVAKHFREYSAHPEFMAQAEQFKYLSHKVLANVFQQASKGDMRAARLFLETVNHQNKQQPAKAPAAQNNYIQINNTILNQETLKQLTAEQLTQIENIVTNTEYKC